MRPCESVRGALGAAPVSRIVRPDVESGWRTSRRVAHRSTTLRAGVVGLGRQAINDHLPALVASPHVELAAVCDEDASVVRQQETLHHVPGFADYREMFEAEALDLVVVCVPHDVGRAVIESAAEHRVHVLNRYGREAITAITELSSPRCYVRLRDLDSIATRHDSDPIVAELRSDLRAVLATTAS
ncbi:Gfo/Idh/MocA family oxidoreductase [Nocardia asteroides]|nr:Gfo/Idh/MocA family oxidoreductase [Nocardia asteroides]